MVEPAYSVRSYEAGDEHGIVELFNAVFDGERSGRRTLEQWRWLFDSHSRERQVAVGVASDGRIISHYGAIPLRVQVGDAVHVAAQIVDSMVHPDWRRGLQREGPFLRTARHFFDLWSSMPRNAIHYGFPNRRAYPIGRRFLRYTPFVEPVPVLYRNFFEDPDDGAVGRRHAGALEVVEVARFGGEMDELWSRVRSAYPLALVRDAEYLRWRFDECPWLPYRRHLLREPDGGRLRGYFVTRPSWQGQPILAVTDFLAAPDDEAALAVALRTATLQARASGQARVEAWLPERHPTFRHALAAGFRTEPGGNVLCMNLFVESPTREEALQRCYYTIGDSDVW
jgi:hypothetical protein